jgi:cobalt-zinc-cadmium efflux system membrane fusion protein
MVCARLAGLFRGKLPAAVAAACLIAQPVWHAARAADAPSGGADVGDTLDLTSEQVKAISIGVLCQRIFAIQETAVGNIDFDEDLETQVYPPYQGRILQIFARGGDTVRQGQALFTVDSPDLVQAESTLIAADGVLRMTTRALQRAVDLYHTRGLAQKDYDQAVSDQQTAEGSMRAARDAVRIFGKTPAEIDRIIAGRQVDPALEVRSPVNGVVVTRSAAPGVFVQPGNAPAPFTIADNSVMWMLASAPENLSTAFKVGQPVTVQIDALPGHSFTGKVQVVGTVIDPATRRFILRSEIADPNHALRSGMFASFQITTGTPVTSLAVPMNGVVREGDGTESVWTTTDGHHFVRRAVTIGIAADGYRQILGGLSAGEHVVTDGAVFLSNMLTAGPT